MVSLASLPSIRLEKYYIKVLLDQWPKMTHDDIFDNIEYRNCMDLIVNHCLLYELEMDFICSPKCNKEILQALLTDN